MNQNHSLTLENRKLLTLHGVCEVESSDDKLVMLKTDMGKLKISGSSLSIGKLNVETGELSLSGNINSMDYKETKPNGGFFTSLFK